MSNQDYTEFSAALEDQCTLSILSNAPVIRAYVEDGQIIEIGCFRDVVLPAATMQGLIAASLVGTSIPGMKYYEDTLVKWNSIAPRRGDVRNDLLQAMRRLATWLRPCPEEQFVETLKDALISLQMEHEQSLRDPVQVHGMLDALKGNGISYTPYK